MNTETDENTSGQAGRILQWIKRYSRMIVAVPTIGLLAVSAYWYVNRDIPQPLPISAAVTVPAYSAVVDNQIRPAPLLITFTTAAFEAGVIYMASGDTAGVARLSDLEQRVTPQIRMEPFIAGDWVWTNDHTLKFTPGEDWPAGQEYSVRFAASLFADYIKPVASVSFATLPFAAEIKDFRFYSDPTQVGVRNTVATLRFTHPIVPEVLEANLSLLMREDGKTIRDKAMEYEFTTEYDAVRREVYVHSAPIELPENPNIMRLVLDERLQAERGPSRLGKALEAETQIPDVASYFRVESINGQIFRNDEGQPFQTLLLKFTDRVRGSDIERKVTAYVLPKDKVEQNRTSRDYRWRTPREVTDETLRAAEKISLSYNPGDDEFSQLHSFRFDADEKRYLYIKVEGGLQSEGLFVMRQASDAVIPIPDYPKESRIVREGSIIPLSGDKALTFVSRGVAALKIEVARLLPDRINHLVSQTYGDMESPRFGNYQFNENDITEKFSKLIPLAAAHPRDAVYSHLDLSEYMRKEDGSRAQGMFFIKVQGWDEKTKRLLGESDRRFVLVTDLGFVVKRNADQSQDVFVQSISRRVPAGQVGVSVLGRNGLPIYSAVTDANGHVTIPDLKDYRDEKQATVYLLGRGDDLSFMPYQSSERTLEYSRFDISGVYTNYSRSAEQRVKGFVFNDRGIYRPGDSVHLGMLVKREDWASLDTVPVMLTISDPRGQEIVREDLRLNETGFLSYTMPTNAASPTGEYTAELFLISTENRYQRISIGSSTFKVEEFQPDTMRINTSIDGAIGRAWMKPENLSATVKLENLFGTPAIDRRVTAQYTLTPANLYFPDFKEFRFEDPLRHDHANLRNVQHPLPEVRSDQQGTATLALPLTKYSQGIYRVRLDVEGYESGGGRSVRSSTSVMISPLAYVVGWKADGDLGWVQRNAERSVELVAIGPDGKPLAVSNLLLKQYEQQYVSTLVRQKDGTYAYQSTLRNVLKSEAPFAIENTRESLRLPSAVPGRYRFELTDTKGMVLAGVNYNVVGEANLAAKLEKNAELAIQLDDSDYAAGEQIRVQITAPYTGSGLITIERDKVYAYKWFSVDTTSTVQSITVPNGIEGNAYVNVAFIRSPESPEVFVSPLSYAVAPFSVDRSRRVVDITLDAADKVVPGEMLTIRYRASKPAKLALFAVDEGILQVANYRIPDPVAYFFQKRALQVSTSQILDLILPEYRMVREASRAGGDEAAAELLGANLNPFRRKTEAPVVYWAGLVDADQSSRELQYRVPDYFNGRMRIMAVAAATDAVGSEEAASTVRGPFVLMPNVITVAAPGDEFIVTLGVANTLENSGDNALVKVSAEVSGQLEILAGKEQQIEIGEGEEGRLEYRLRAGNQLGSASIRFMASLGDARVSRETTLSVRPAVPFETRTVAGVAAAQDSKIEMPRQLRAEFAEQRAAASISPLVLADGLTAYLEYFPHACTEQMVSKVFPYIGLLDSRIFPVDSPSMRDAFAATVSHLRSRQGGDGGFRFWPTSSESAEFPSVYVTHFLTDAREQGLVVPQDVLQNALAYVEKIAARPIDSLSAARTRAYAIYLLTRNGKVTTNYLTHLHEGLNATDPDRGWQADLAAAYMAASYQLLQNRDLANSLLGHYKLIDARGWYSDFDTRLGRDSQYVYLLARHFPERANELDAIVLNGLAKPIFEGDYNTLSASYATLGLGAWTAMLQNGGSLPEVVIAGEDAAGKSLDTKSLDRGAISRAVLPLAVRRATFDANSDKQLIYMITQAGFDQQPPVEAFSEGIELTRRYRDANGKVVTTAKQGDELTVELVVRSSKGHLSNVAVIDLLPGGFEVLLDSVRDRYDHWRMDYRDVREDRVVIYGSFDGNATTITYKVKVTGAGEFIVPAASAAAMYDRSVRARTATGRFSVSKGQ